MRTKRTPHPNARTAALPNVTRVGLKRRLATDLYHSLLTASWPQLFCLLLSGFVATNALFALAYLVTGDGITHARAGSFADAFFFSVQTMATIGYGEMAPRTLAAHVLVTIEALVGVIGFAVVAGLAFAKFSRPTARVLFSRVAVVAKRDGRPCLMFRMANERGTSIVEAQAHVALIRRERTLEGEDVRRFYDLALQRQSNILFALSWTVVHPIDEHSPIAGETLESLAASDVMIIVSLMGLDETFGQTVHARHVYTAHDIRWNARFVDILSTRADGQLAVDYSRFHDVVQE
jgi:inward rectifier potassium channel